MKLILVAGTEHTDKSRLIGTAISTLNNGNGYKDFSHINFNGMESVKNSFSGLSDMKESYMNMYEDLEKVLTNSKRNAFNIILDASFALDTHYGYVPLLTERFFSIFKPDAILLLENKMEDFKDNPRELLKVREQQEVNRAYCIKFASQFSIPVKIMKVSKTDIKGSSKEIQDYFLAVHRASF